MKYFLGLLLAFFVLFTIEVPFVRITKGQHQPSSNVANELKYEPDPLRYLGFLPGAHPAINLHKQMFYELLVKKGLVYMYDHDYDVEPDSPIIRSDAELGIDYGELKQRTKRPGMKTKFPKKVLVIGAGISGLSAAYELKRAGHEVTILERESRAGGRIYRFKFHVQPSSELHGEAGAMRFPPEGVHYLVDAYINKFKLETIPFYNIDPQKNCFVSVEGETARVYDFISDNQTDRAIAKAMCDKLWPGWDRRIIKNGLRTKYRIDHVVDYYKLTIEEVINSAPTIWRDSGNLSFDPEVDKFNQVEIFLKSPEEYAHEWREWMVRWSKMSFTEFLSSGASSSESKATFRPWPVEAINAISNIEYLGYSEVSIATMLSEAVGGWQSAQMRTVKGGMNKFPHAFIKNVEDPYYLENDIHYGITVRTVEWRKPGDDKCSYHVKVSGRQTQTQNEVYFEADAVIITLPLNILRQMVFKPALPLRVTDAIAGIRYEPGTKIFLGFRERFWEKGKYPISDGGISKTNLPISMIVYPRKIIHDDGGKIKRGVLLSYTFNKEALHFGSQSKDAIITEALRELETIYEGLLGKNVSESITELFEFGAVHPWYDDSSAEGGWVHLLPYSYMDNLRVLLEPKDIRPIFFGGEAVSSANGYIQGALESGLRAAWQFFKFNEQSCLNEGIPPPKTGQRPNPFNDDDFNPNERLNLPFLGLSKYPFPI